MSEEQSERKKVKFETIKKVEQKFGNRNFIEVARKKAITDESVNVFISVSRGFYTGEMPKYKTCVAMPDTKEIKEFIAKEILEI